MGSIVVSTAEDSLLTIFTIDYKNTSVLLHSVHLSTQLRELIETRSKRSPKGGKGSTFKKVAVGAVAGAATYHVASQASKGFKGSFQTTEAPKKYKRVYACFSRVGGQCALNYNNWQSVDSSSSSSSTTTTSTTTTEAATTIPTSTVASENVTSSTNVTEPTTTTSTTTTAAPTAAAQTQPLDISKIPKCIEHAVCKHGSPSQGNGTSTFLQKVDFDPRLGVCECEAGYERTSKDICVKVKRSGAAEKTVAGAVIIAALAFNKMFAF
ncbi:hypothetical protein Ocin01_06998 [Orchesella cincta]|uniref:Uncharacterized protein n=1 Tax=Orchesella cincta TaxID=48709 RepID=A0A1D2N367_ORCCI|nr:hypothetical protein Ocin01_06998 [Orchesella cincta]